MLVVNRNLPSPDLSLIFSVRMVEKKMLKKSDADIFIILNIIES